MVYVLTEEMVMAPAVVSRQHCKVSGAPLPVLPAKLDIMVVNAPFHAQA